MASGDTKTEALLNILGNGGSTEGISGCANTKTQNYILDAINRIQGVENEVEEIKNNPDVSDIVATYADLQAYDKSKLTDKDVIRVLSDETHDGDSTYYRYSKSSNSFTYIGESKQYSNFVGTDGTAAGAAGLVPAPATTDAGKFLKADGTWGEAGGGGSGIIELTTADYDWPTDNPNRVALWKLTPGVYYAKSSVTCLPASRNGGLASGGTFIVSKTDDSHVGIIYCNPNNTFELNWLTVTVSTGEVFQNPQSTFRLSNTLTSSSTQAALTAAQGKVLNGKITPTSASGAPTASTAGELGKIYIDTDTNTAYMCVNVSGSTYTWKQITA